MNAVPVILLILASIFVLPFVIYAGFLIMGKVFGAILWFVGRVFGFIGATISDAIRLIGSLITAVVFAPLIVLSIVVGRWSSCKHFSRAFSSECAGAMSSVYRLFVGNPARLLGLSGALEGVERRVPDAIAGAPTRDTPSKRRIGMFEGYTIVGSLRAGGSGGKLYIAEPDDIKRAGFDRRGIDVDQVVIKVFSLKDGSSLPQIVRESRALDAARDLGLVLEHELTSERFFYVMRYVSGEQLSSVTQRMHAVSPAEGLDDKNLAHAMRYAGDMLSALIVYHDAGLWHKDVKPDNIIVDAQSNGAKAQLVDFGLVTPLRSAMTLTTHGTEYFRDPELVRQALRGVKVHQIDGTKFDVYGAGAVLYSVIENSFPAHSGLSQITKRCPDALRWIVRRSMAEYDQRYATAREMLADLRVVMEAPDPFALRPADLPSVSGGPVDFGAPAPEPFVAPRRDPSPDPVGVRRAASPVPRGGRVARPRVRGLDWWSGRYTAQRDPAPPPVEPAASRGDPIRERVAHTGPRPSAKVQRRNARARVREMRRRASTRRSTHAKGRYTNDPHPIVGFTFAGFFMLALGLAIFLSKSDKDSTSVVVSSEVVETTAPIPEVSARLLFVLESPEALGSPEARAQLGVLRDQGVEFVGETPGTDGGDAVERLAAFRNAIGAVPNDSDEYIQRSREWITAQPDLDGAFVMGVRGADPDTPHAMLVSDRFFVRSPVGPDLARIALGVLESHGLGR